VKWRAKRVAKRSGAMQPRNTGFVFEWNADEKKMLLKQKDALLFIF